METLRSPTQLSQSQPLTFNTLLIDFSQSLSSPFLVPWFDSAQERPEEVEELLTISRRLIQQKASFSSSRRSRPHWRNKFHRYVFKTLSRKKFDLNPPNRTQDWE